MDKTLVDKAIHAALVGDWPTALAINLQLIATNPNDIATLNRLAKAYTELNDCTNARLTYEKVLKLDRFNPIAAKNVKALSHRVHIPGATATHINLNFIEEPGRTKALTLTRLGEPKVLCKLVSGQIVSLLCKNHAVSIITDSHEYVGALTDDIAYTLKKHLDLGNKYSVVIKSASPQNVTIFIRETFRDERLGDTPTFTNTLLST